MSKVSVMRANGVVYPWRTYLAARAAGLPLAVACALLFQESDGGHNVFGHDPTIFSGAGEVTEAKYKAYKALRAKTGMMQGVGPTQLTWYEFQDRADREGGCWRPFVNMKVGFSIMTAYLKTYTLREAFARYNGSGPYEAYATRTLQRYTEWRSKLA